jgi:hypothetical protein
MSSASPLFPRIVFARHDGKFDVLSTDGEGREETVRTSVDFRTAKEIARSGVNGGTLGYRDWQTPKRTVPFTPRSLEDL